MNTGHLLGRDRSGLSDKKKKKCIYKKARVGNAPSLKFMLVLAISLCFFLRKKANILSVHGGRGSLTDEEEGSELRLPPAAQDRCCPAQVPALPLPTVGGSQRQGITLSVGKASNTLLPPASVCSRPSSSETETSSPGCQPEDARGLCPGFTFYGEARGGRSEPAPLTWPPYPRPGRPPPPRRVWERGAGRARCAGVGAQEQPASGAGGWGAEARAGLAVAAGETGASSGGQASRTCVLALGEQKENNIWFLYLATGTEPST